MVLCVSLKTCMQIICQTSKSHYCSLQFCNMGKLLWWTRSTNVVNVVGNSRFKFKLMKKF